jgi:hypothetical protein
VTPGFNPRVAHCLVGRMTSRQVFSSVVPCQLSFHRRSSSALRRIASPLESAVPHRRGFTPHQNCIKLNSHLLCGRSVYWNEILAPKIGRTAKRPHVNAVYFPVVLHPPRLFGKQPSSAPSLEKLQNHFAFQFHLPCHFTNPAV